MSSPGWPSPLGRRLLPRFHQPEPRIGGEEDDEIADVDHAARIVEGLVIDRQARMAGGAKQSSTSLKGVSSASAMMSARGTITSSTRTSCSASTFLRMARSCGVNSSLALSSIASSISSRAEARRQAEQRPHALEQARGLFARNAGRRFRRRSALVRHVIRQRLRAHRVGRPEPRQNPCLERLHALRLCVRLVIVADQMQKSMGDEMAIVVGERHAELLGLARERLEGERDVAERRRRPRRRSRVGRRKGEHVGRLVDAAPARVERAQRGIVGEAEAHVGAWASVRTPVLPAVYARPALSAAAAIVSRAIARARGNPRHRREAR